MPVTSLGLALLLTCVPAGGEAQTLESELGVESSPSVSSDDDSTRAELAAPAELSVDNPLVVDAQGVMHAMAGVDPSPGLKLTVELPLRFSAVPASNGVGTNVLPFVGVRVGARYPIRFGVAQLELGGDLAGLFASRSDGNTTVAVARLLGALEGRGLVGLRLGTGQFGLMPYFALGGLVGAGLGAAEVIGSPRYRVLGAWAARGTGGLQVSLWMLDVGFELGVGFRDFRAEILGATSVGVSF